MKVDFKGAQRLHSACTFRKGDGLRNFDYGAIVHYDLPGPPRPSPAAYWEWVMAADGSRDYEYKTYAVGRWSELHLGLPRGRSWEVHAWAYTYAYRWVLPEEEKRDAVGELDDDGDAGEEDDECDYDTEVDTVSVQSAEVDEHWVYLMDTSMVD